MRTLFLATAVAILGTACASSEPRERYGRRYDDRRDQVFDAYTTDGAYVRVQQDPRSGDLMIVEPAALNGQHALMVNQDPGNGMPLVEIAAGPQYRRYQGSGGDRGEPRDRGDQRGDDRRDDHDRSHDDHH